MSGIIDIIIDKLKGLFTTDKIEIEGYLILKDVTTNKTQLLVKDGNKSWRTKWFDDNQYSYKAPIKPITYVFMKYV